MKFPRNARIFRGQLDAAPFASVLFLLIMFLWLAGLVYTPGIRLQLPTAQGLTGIEKAPIAVAVDAHGRLYYENQPMLEPELLGRLRAAVQNSPEPLVLVILADKKVSYDVIVRLSTLARDAGISEAMLAALPRMGPAPELLLP
jgi:biopolymer transport protein ExbD